MSNDHPKRETISLEGLAISHMLEIAALVERKGLCTNQDHFNIITE